MKIHPKSSGLRLSINVKGPQGYENLRAIVDTGASFCLLPTRTITAIGYNINKPFIKEKVIGVTTPWIPLFKTQSVEGLGLTIEDCLVGAYDLLYEAPVDALLGLSFLRHFRFTLDMPGGFFALRYSPYYGLRR